MYYIIRKDFSRVKYHKTGQIRGQAKDIYCGIRRSVERVEVKKNEKGSDYKMVCILRYYFLTLFIITEGEKGRTECLDVSVVNDIANCIKLLLTELKRRTQCELIFVSNV